MRFIFMLISILAFESSAISQLLYFSNDRTILSYETSKGVIDTIWQAPFTVNDISVSQDGQVITFTKPLSEDKPDRSVGYYLVGEKKYRLNPSRSDNNFGAIASPGGEWIVFNVYLDNRWQVSLMDRKANTVNYDIFQYKDDVFSPYGWESDSVLEIMTFAGAVRQNIFTREYSIMALPKELANNYGLPGTKWLRYNDSLSYINAYDQRPEIESLDGPAESLYEINHGKYRAILKGKIDVNDFFLCGNKVFIQYTDYSSKKGNVRLGVYDITTGNIKTIKAGLIGGSFRLVGSIKN
jgi:hypothetical protein